MGENVKSSSSMNTFLRYCMCNIQVNHITEPHLLSVMCPLIETSTAWGVESMSLPLCQMPRNPAQGNFRISLCFGRLSSSRSSVILWSFLSSSLSVESHRVDGGEDGLRTAPGERLNYVVNSPPAGPFLALGLSSYLLKSDEKREKWVRIDL